MRVQLSLSSVSFNLQQAQPQGGFPGSVGVDMQFLNDAGNQITGLGLGLDVGRVNTAAEAAEGALTQVVQLGNAIAAEAQRQLDLTKTDNRGSGEPPAPPR